MELLKKGAEACLYLDTYHELEVIKKVRTPKSYRNSRIDIFIRKFRTAHEAKLLHDAKTAGVSTPTVYDVDLPITTLTMAYLEGAVARDVADDLAAADRHACFRAIGGDVARLHSHGIVHGDLTTSNFIMSKHGAVSLIDFGLGEYSRSLEGAAVDVHLLLRALESSHNTIARDAFQSFAEGYKAVIPGKWSHIWNHVNEIRKRGRYVEERRLRRNSGELKTTA